MGARAILDDPKCRLRSRATGLPDLGAIIVRNYHEVVSRLDRGGRRRRRRGNDAAILPRAAARSSGGRPKAEICKESRGVISPGLREGCCACQAAREPRLPSCDGRGPVRPPRQKTMLAILLSGRAPYVTSLTAGMAPWHINASVHAVLRPAVLRVGQSGSHRSPAAMTAATPASCLPTAGVLRNSRRRAPRVQPGPRCRAIRSLRWVPGTATRHRLPPACSPPRRPRSRARRARRGRQRCCRCGSGT